MRLLFLPLLILLLASPALASEQPGWTGNTELDDAFAHNNAGRYDKAFDLFAKLEAKNVPMAGTMLGRYYEDGRAVPRDADKALALFAAARGKGEALGTYHHARVTTGNWRRMTGEEFKKLVAVLTVEAEKGNVPVQTVLASTFYLLSGAGPERSWWTPPEARRLAAKWMLQAAEAGYAPAQSNMYLFDRENGRKWTEKAAAAGYPPAIRALGR